MWVLRELTGGAVSRILIRWRIESKGMGVDGREGECAVSLICIV